MNKRIRMLAITPILIMLITACSTTSSYQSTQDRMKQKIDAISTLDQRVQEAQTESQRQTLLKEQHQAIQDGIALLKERQQEKREARRRCIEQEKNLPTDQETCYAFESLEDTQANLMVLLLEQMAKRVGTD